MKKITAVIPVRQGSQRVKNKNFKRFAGKSLLEHKIDMVKRLPVDKIIVNTDSEYAISLAIKNGIEYHKRDAYYASSECTNSEYHEYLARVTPGEHILVAQVTAPLILESTYIEAIDIYNNVDCDSLMSVKPVKDFLWYEDKPINYRLDYAPNSQDLPNYFSPTFGLIICNKKSMLKDKNLICGKSYFYELNSTEAIDIDTPTDFEFAEFLYKKNRNTFNVDDFKSMVAEREKDVIAVDFDGVIHKNSKGFYDGTVYDEPIEGVKKGLEYLSKSCKLILYTCKANPKRPLINGKTGEELIWEWLDKNSLKEYISEITFEKPNVKYYIDDKAIKFESWDKIIKEFNV